MNSKIKQFAFDMDKELIANNKKGDWQEWNNIEEMLADLEWHKAKLLFALKEPDKNKVREHLADCANILMFIGNAGHLYNEQETVNESKESAGSWISIEEDLPKKNKMYLVYNTNMFGTDKRDVARFDTYNQTWYQGSDTIHPTHWMQLPTPPEQAKGTWIKGTEAWPNRVGSFTIRYSNERFDSYYIGEVTERAKETWFAIADRFEWWYQPKQEEVPVSEDKLHTHIEEMDNFIAEMKNKIKNESKESGNDAIEVNVEFLDMDKMVLTRKSGDTFTAMNTRRNEQLFDFFHSKDKFESQPQKENDDWQQKLFDYMSKEHDVTLLQSDMAEIRNIIIPRHFPETIWPEQKDDKNEAIAFADWLSGEGYVIYDGVGRWIAPLNNNHVYTTEELYEQYLQSLK